MDRSCNACVALCCFVDAEEWNNQKFPAIHYMLAELDRKKRKLLLARRLQPVAENVFGDIFDLPGPCWCYKQEALVTPERPDVIVAGFPCQDLSLLRRRQVAFVEGSTSADTFRKIVALADEWKPALVILENVYAVLHHRSCDDGARPWDTMSLGC